MEVNMKKYINEEKVVKNELYIDLRDSIVCSICSDILINPFMCCQCHNSFCKICLDELSPNNDKCPCKCENPHFIKSLDKINILSKLKFKCEKCGGEILYDDFINHCTICVQNRKQHRLERLTKDESIKIKDKLKDSLHATSK